MRSAYGGGMSLIRRLGAGAVVARSVLTPLERPDRLPRAIAAMAPWGQSVAGLVAGAAARYPDRVAIDDDAGSITYRELWRRRRRSPPACSRTRGRTGHRRRVCWRGTIAASSRRDRRGGHRRPTSCCSTRASPGRSSPTSWTTRASTSSSTTTSSPIVVDRCGAPVLDRRDGAGRHGSRRRARCHRAEDAGRRS